MFRAIVLVPFLLFAAVPLHAQTGGKTYLLHVSAGQRPGDTGTEATKVDLDEHPKLGKVIKVQLVNSFGDRSVEIPNWRNYSALGFNAFNPGKDDVKIGFNVRHKETKNYNTRVDIPITLKPGLNEVRLRTAEMTNSNGSRADLANVTSWYIAIDGKPATLYFGDFWFGGDAAPVGGSAVIKSDPARLARIRAAKMPEITRPISFETPEADAICAALEVFPENNPWNTVIEDWPVHPNSRNIIATCGAAKPLRYNPDMNFVLVPPKQKRIDVQIVNYSRESDRGPYPVPDNVPIECWPLDFLKPKISLLDVQRDTAKRGGDRHAIVVDPVNRMLYEFYTLRRTDFGWVAAQASIFDLTSNRMRPDGWTSTDAAGLPIFPSIIRHDELKRGIVEHAMRVTFDRTRRAYVYPARHQASRLTDVNLPRMGERFRLKKSIDISGFTPEAQAILKGLQKYGMMVADNGLPDWALSVAPDPRIPHMHVELRKIKGSDFEVVEAPPGYAPPR